MWNDFSRSEHSSIWKIQSSCCTFSFTFCYETFYFFFCDVSMCFFSLVGWEIWYLSGFTSTTYESDLRIKKPIQSLLFRFHIVIYLEVKVHEFTKLLLHYPPEDMLESLYIFSMHTDKKRGIRCAQSDREIISLFYDIQRFYSDTEIWEKCSKKGFHKNDCIYYKYIEISLKNNRLWRGGEREIRTPGILRYAPFPRVCTRPLCDLSRWFQEHMEYGGDARRSKPGILRYAPFPRVCDSDHYATSPNSLVLYIKYIFFQEKILTWFLRAFPYTTVST